MPGITLPSNKEKDRACQGVRDDVVQPSTSLCIGLVLSR